MTESPWWQSPRPPEAACGQPDTLFHKIWQCQHTAGLRLAILPSTFQHFVKEDCSICLRALLAHPGQKFPPAANSFKAEFLALDHNGLGLVQEEEFGQLKGPIYTDGSYDKGPHPEMGRAAWAVVQVGPEGHPGKIIRGPVPSDLSLIHI